MPTVATFEIEYLQFLGPDGKLVREDLPEFAKDPKNLVGTSITLTLPDGGATNKVYATSDGGATWRDAGFDEDDVDKVVWRNPLEFFAQSGRLILTTSAIATWPRRSRGTRCCGASARCGSGTPTAASCTWRTAPTSIPPTTSTGSPHSSSATRRGSGSGSTCRCSASGCGWRRPRSPTRAPRTGCARSCAGSGSKS